MRARIFDAARDDRQQLLGQRLAEGAPTSPGRMTSGTTRSSRSRSATSRNVGPAGSINSSVADMARWLVVQTHKGKIDGKPIISPAVLADIHTPQMTTGRAAANARRSRRPGMRWAGRRRLSRPSPRAPRRSDRRLHRARRRCFPTTAWAWSFWPTWMGRRCPRWSPATRPTGFWASRRSIGAARRSARKPRTRPRAKEAKTKKETVRRPGTTPAHPLEEYAGDYEHPGYGIVKIELRDGKLIFIYNGIEAPLEHWHFEVFNASKNPKDPAFEDQEGPVPDQRQGLCRWPRGPVRAQLQADRLRDAAGSPGSPIPSISSGSRASTSWPARTLSVRLERQHSGARLAGAGDR